jgi:hypothetical protein
VLLRQREVWSRNQGQARISLPASRSSAIRTKCWRPSSPCPVKCRNRTILKMTPSHQSRLQFLSVEKPVFTLEPLKEATIVFPLPPLLNPPLPVYQWNQMADRAAVLPTSSHSWTSLSFGGTAACREPNEVSAMDDGLAYLEDRRIQVNNEGKHIVDSKLENPLSTCIRQS